MNAKLDEILNRCLDTPDWFGEDSIGITSVNLMGDTPLHTACIWGQVESVKMLLEAGANVNAKGELGSTPLFNAVIGENPKVVELLIRYGANKNIRNDDNWHVLEFAQSVGCTEAILNILRK